MSMVSKVAAAFASRGHARSSEIAQHTFYELLDELRGQPFDRDVASELWEQAELNSHQQASIDQLSNIICQAQGILVEKITEIQQKIRAEQQRKMRLQQDPNSRQSRQMEIRQIQDSISSLDKDLKEYEQDLELVTSPFNIDQRNIMQSRVLDPRVSAHPDYHSSIGQPSLMTGIPNEQLKWMFFLTIGILFLELYMMFNKYDFLNLIVLVTILQIFILKYFESGYLRICIGLTGISIVMDLIWLMVNAGNYWSPPTNSEFSQLQVPTLRFIVFFTILLMAAKVPLVYLLFKYKDPVPGNTYKIILFGDYKIYLTASQEKNPFSSVFNFP